MTETVKKTASGAILYDQQIIREISDDRFQPSGWLHVAPVASQLGSGGRGNTMYVGNVPQQFVLRHYMRGGVVARLARDSYIWTGEDNTRAFAEWRLLAKLVDKGLRVPRPAAARYRRRGPFYTADLITVRIPDVVPLSAAIATKAQPPEFWESVGRAVREFHSAGVHHADMSAHNLQIDADGDLWMLDFDRGRLESPGHWQQRTLSRLHRSLEKIVTQDPQLHFRPLNWEQFLSGYFAASKSA